MVCSSSRVEPVPRPAQNLLVVGALVLVPQEQRLHPRPRQRELQFVRAVGWVHVHQRRARPRAAHVHHDPLGAVGGPQANAVAAPNAQRPQSSRHAVRIVAQFTPGEALALVARNHRRPVANPVCRAVQQIANGQIEQRTARPACVAQHGNALFNRHVSPGPVRTKGVYASMKAHRVIRHTGGRRDLPGSDQSTAKTAEYPTSRL